MHLNDLKIIFQSYPGYGQVHPQAPSRIGHAPYHQQMDINPHQYGLPHAQQSHSNVPPQHQTHQNVSSHQGGMAPNLQGPPQVHLHHVGPPSLHHASRQPSSVPSSISGSHGVPPQGPYSSPHHTLSYQPHQLQPALDVNMGVTSQYGAQKPQGLDSPQYRPPFQQLSPQISPRTQMSPRPPAPSQLSPRPPISPVKGPNASPHTSRPLTQSPSTQSNTTFNSQNTLQALEQMVLPGATEYSYQRNPASPAIGHMASPSHWNQTKISGPSNTSLPIETVEKSSVTDSLTASAMPIYTDPTQHRKNISSVDPKHELIHKIEQADKTLDRLGHMVENKNIVPILDIASRSANSNIAQATNDLKSEDEQVNINITTEVDVASDTQQSVNKESQQNNSEQTFIVNQDNVEPKPQNIEIAQVAKPDNLVEEPAIGINLPLPTDSSAQPVNENNITQVSVSQAMTDNISVNIESLNTNTTNSVQGINVNRNITYPVNSLQINTSHTTTVINQAPIQNLPSTISPVVAQTANSMQSNFPISHSNQAVPNSASAIKNSPGNMSTAVNETATQANVPTNIPHIAHMGTMSGIVPNIPSTTGSISTNIPSNITNVPMNMPLGMPPLHPGIGPSSQNNVLPPITHAMTANIPMMMGPSSIPHPNMPPIYTSPISHPQERMGIQQQIQDIFCMPPTPENQEKLRCLQERLAMLQQHETNDKCSGGPNCILQNPVYGSKMVESPQVSSTTGRGRSKGPSRPRKPRAKKDKSVSLAQPLDQLPVSEDCVTAGTGLQNLGMDIDGDFNDDTINLDSSVLPYDIGVDGKVKKPRAPRKNKERKPRVPKEQKPPKPKPDKPVKERKKREPKDPNAPRRKRVSKKDEGDIQADTTTVYETTDQNLAKETTTLNECTLPSDATIPSADLPKTEESNVTDFDDIPVSKIAIKDLLEEADAKRELVDKEDDNDLFNLSPKKKVGKRRSLGGSCRKAAAKRLHAGRRKKRGGIIPDSDGEPDDLITTPPPSPPAEGDCDSLKRRSARNTQRKKYTDDVMLRLSDEEFAVLPAVKREKEKLEQINVDFKEGSKPDGTPKPNYMYINTTDEDTMIVQHVLSCRMGKREMKPEIIMPIQNIDEITNKCEDHVELGTEITEIKVEKSETDGISKDESVNNICEENANPENEETIAVYKDVENTETNIESKDVLKSEVEIETDDKNETSIKIETVVLNNEKPIVVDVEEYYVKYRNFSYLHCEWKTEEELYKGDKRINSKIKRFKQKQAQQVNIFELLDDEPFNPDYIEVERILDMSDTVDPGNESSVKHYLVKWKSLQYEDSTWELEEDIDVDKIKQFKDFHELPPKEKWKFKRRPSADQWVQLNESPLYKGGNTLRPYQLEGLNWLLFSWHNNRNCILADEMGLGKTIQSLTYVNSIWEYGIRGPFLIIAPLSTIPNWQREFEGWTDMNVIVYHGSQQSKSMIQEYEFYYKGENNTPVKEITKFNVLITTFEMIVTDFQDLKIFNWRACVIDEAHRLKNRNCKLLEGLRQLHLEHRVLLSGTPLQNNVNELFSLLNFLEPSQFSSSDAFLNEFGQLKSESEVIKLQALLKPMMLRRLKEDVEKSLAPKEETIIEVELTNIQKKYYRAILERNFSFLRKGTNSAANIPNLMNTMMELRKCCIHPYLLNGAEDQIQFDYKQANGEDKQAYYKALIQSSGKMVLVDKLLPKLKAGGHRVLIFSQMVRCLDILEDYLMYRKYPYERIDGRIRGNLRQEAIDRFSKPDSDRFVFLLCTKAGGLGINLTAADTVIIYDSDWNPQNDLQAQARCHRIGQQKMVKIYRLICRNTYEREMFDKASLKLGLDKAILQSMNTSQGKETGLRQLSKKEIEDLLKKGAYGAVMDEDNAGDKFCEEDIEMILARRTQVIQMESEKGSTFSKASFASADQRSDIDIRDPDFWNKWAKKAEIDTTEKNEEEILIVTEPRRRTLIKRYGHDDSTMEMSDMEVTPDSEDDEDGTVLLSFIYLTFHCWLSFLFY